MGGVFDDGIDAEEMGIILGVSDEYSCPQNLQLKFLKVVTELFGGKFGMSI
jgi:hypothetical protein